MTYSKGGLTLNAGVSSFTSHDIATPFKKTIKQNSTLSMDVTILQKTIKFT